MTWYLLYFTSTGQPDSYGTVLADPLPVGFTVRELSDDERDGVLNGCLIWNAETLSFDINPHWAPEPTEPEVV
jgi:hypothetical protein